jgi:hypothetical protein
MRGSRIRRDVDLEKLKQDLRGLRGEDTPETQAVDSIVPFNISAATLKKAVRAATGSDLDVSEGTIDNYIYGKPEQAKRQAKQKDLITKLSEFIYGTRLGRAMRSTIDDAKTPHDDLTDALTIETDKYDITGRYLVYHGAYLSEGRFAIRAMDISVDDNYILSVKDYIKDPTTSVGIRNRTRTSTGCILFWDRHPHFILNSTDNRVGLNLIVCSVPVFEDGVEIQGVMLGMTAKNFPFFRKILMVRQVDMNLKELIDQTGVFTLEELEKMEKDGPGCARDHLQKLRGLAELTSFDEQYPDAVRTLKKPPKNLKLPDLSSLSSTDKDALIVALHQRVDALLTQVDALAKSRQ